jgi:WD40 repeat protein
MSKAPDTENKNSELSIPKGFKLRHTLQGHSDIITQIAWSKDGDELATASKDNTIRIFNAETGELKFVLEGHTDNVVGIAWSTYGGTIASVSEDNTIKLWNTNTGNLRSTINDEKCSSIAWSPDGKTFASDIKYSSKEIKFWDAKTEKQRDIKTNKSEIIFSGGIGNLVYGSSINNINIYTEVSNFGSVNVTMRNMVDRRRSFSETIKSSRIGNLA